MRSEKQKNQKERLARQLARCNTEANKGGLMAQFLIRSILILAISSGAYLHASKISARNDALQFRYLEIEGTEEADCTHTTTNSIDWDVICKLRNKELKYTVHLKLSYYPKTNTGYPAYEFLYWISDLTGAATMGDSVSQWIYLDSAQSKIKKFQTRLGIENDRSYLQLQIDLSK